MTYSTYQGEPIFDYFMHAPGVQDYPTGRGGRTTTAGSGIAPLGKRVVLRNVYPTNGYTSGTAVNVTNGDGSVTYFSLVMPGNVNGLSSIMDIVLPDGLGVSGGLGASFIVSYRLLD